MQRVFLDVLEKRILYQSGWDQSVHPEGDPRLASGERLGSLLSLGPQSVIVRCKCTINLGPNKVSEGEASFRYPE